MNPLEPKVAASLCICSKLIHCWELWNLFMDEAKYDLRQCVIPSSFWKLPQGLLFHLMFTENTMLASLSSWFHIEQPHLSSMRHQQAILGSTKVPRTSSREYQDPKGKAYELADAKVSCLWLGNSRTYCNKMLKINPKLFLKYHGITEDSNCCLQAPRQPKCWYQAKVHSVKSSLAHNWKNH